LGFFKTTFFEPINLFRGESLSLSLAYHELVANFFTGYHGAQPPKSELGKTILSSRASRPDRIRRADAEARVD
jgi:hypothetical protein